MGNPGVSKVEALRSGDAPRPGLTDPWARRWTLVAGIALLANFLVPWSSGHFAWPWEVLRDASWERAIRYLEWPALGVVALAVRRWASPKVGGVALTVAAAGAILDDYAVFRWDTSIWVPGMNLATMKVVALLPIFLGFPLVVAGNRLRKLHPDEKVAGLIARGGAGLLLIGLWLPIREGRPIAALLIDAEHWKTNWSFNVVLAATLAVGVIGILPASRRKPAALPAVLSVLARALAVAIPVAFLTTAYLSGDPEWVEARKRGFAMPVLMVGKWYVEDLGLLVLLAVGLVTWLDPVLESRTSVSSRRSAALTDGTGPALA